jgi:hypothetical protein
MRMGMPRVEKAELYHPPPAGGIAAHCKHGGEDAARSHQCFVRHGCAADSCKSIDSMHVLKYACNQCRMLGSNSPATLLLHGSSLVCLRHVFTTNAPGHRCLGAAAQHAAAAAAVAAAASLLAVVSPQFCMPQQTVLVMQERADVFKSDDFTITDATGIV